MNKYEQVLQYSLSNRNNPEAREFLKRVSSGEFNSNISESMLYKTQDLLGNEIKNLPSKNIKAVKGAFKKTQSLLGSYVAGIKQSFQTGEKEGEEMQERRLGIESRPLGIGRTISRGLEEVGKPILGALEGATTPIADLAIKAGKAVLGEKQEQFVANTAQDLAQKYEDFKSNLSPEARVKFDEVATTLGLAGAVSGAGVAKKGVQAGVKSAKKGIVEAIESPDFQAGLDTGLKAGQQAREAVGEMTQKAKQIADERLLATRLNKLAKVDEQRYKFTDEILQTPINELKKTPVGVSTETTKFVADKIKQAKTFKDIANNLDEIGKEAISKVNAKIAKIYYEPISEDYLFPLRREVVDLERDPTKSKITAIYKKLLTEEEKALNAKGGIYNLGEAQRRKIQLNKDLKKYFEAIDPTPLEKAELQARDLLREGFMNEIERLAGKDIGQLNRIYGSVSDAKKYLNTVEARFRRAVTPTSQVFSESPLQYALTKVPFIKSLINRNGIVDNVLTPRSSTLIEILPERTKTINKLTQKSKELKQKTNLSKTK